MEQNTRNTWAEIVAGVSNIRREKERERERERDRERGKERDRERIGEGERVGLGPWKLHHPNHHPANRLRVMIWVTPLRPKKVPKWKQNDMNIDPELALKGSGALENCITQTITWPPASWWWFGWCHFNPHQPAFRLFLRAPGHRLDLKSHRPNTVQ